MVGLEAVLKRWKEYFEKLMNKENDRQPRTEEAEVVNEEVNCVSREEVKNALKKTKVKRLGQMSCMGVINLICMGEVQFGSAWEKWG